MWKEIQRMRWSLAGLASLLVLAGAPARAETQGADRTPADFLALRDAYAAGAGYDPYGAKIAGLRAALHDAYAKDDCEAVLARAKDVFAIDFIQLEAHLMVADCYAAAGDAAAEDREQAIIKGLMRSILMSGDGASPETAYDVVTIDEEYFVLALVGDDIVSQSLVEQSRHSYDRFDVVEGKTGKPKAVFFRIDKIVAALENELRAAAQ
jgi:hypothetical protein